MASYTIPLIQVPAQEFSAQLGANLLRFKIQWLTQYEMFRVDILRADNTPVTQGRILNAGVDLFNSVYPTPEEGLYGTLVLTGDEPTPDNLGLNNALVWNDG